MDPLVSSTNHRKREPIVKCHQSLAREPPSQRSVPESRSDRCTMFRLAPVVGLSVFQRVKAFAVLEEHDHSTALGEPSVQADGARYAPTAGWTTPRGKMRHRFLPKANRRRSLARNNSGELYRNRQCRCVGCTAHAVSF